MSGRSAKRLSGFPHKFARLRLAKVLLVLTLGALLLANLRNSGRKGAALPISRSGGEVATSFSTPLMSVWTAVNTTLSHGELVPISGQPPNLATGSPKVAETGYTADATTDYGYDADGDRCFAGSSTGTCATPPSGSTTYGWNALGEMCWSATGASTGSCTSPPTSATTYAYDGDGLLATTTPHSGTATDLTWDTVSDMAPHLLLDGTNAYIYGPDATGAGTTAPVEEISLSSSTPTYTYSDRTGLELLVSSSGVVDASNTYTDYGTQTSASWSTASAPFGFKGSYTAGPGIFTYLVARNYDSATGQFISLDPAVELTGERYAYGADDPTNMVDPAGLACGAEGGASQGATYEDQLPQAQEDFPNKAGQTELHHVWPKYLGGDVNGETVPIDAAYHQEITNAFRAAWPYGQGPPPPGVAQAIMREVYSQWPLP